MKEEELLKKVFWSGQKDNMLGNMIFSHTDESFTNTIEVAVSRQEQGVEIAYSSAQMLNPTEKEYFVKLFFVRDGENNLVVDKNKSSPEILTDADVKDVIETVSNAIIKMNVNPDFFPTGVLKSPESKMKLN